MPRVCRADVSTTTIHVPPRIVVCRYVPALAMPPPQPFFLAPSAWPRLVSDIFAFTASGSVYATAGKTTVRVRVCACACAVCVPLKQLGQYQSTCVRGKKRR